MTRLQERFLTGVMALLLAFLLFHGDFSFSRQDGPVGEKNRLERLFRWGKMHYQAGKYRKAVRMLELLLSYFDEKEEVKSKDIDPRNRELKGKIYLLLGAAYERLGGRRRARKNYRLSHELLEDPKIEGIDMSRLTEYQRIFTGKKKGG